MPQDSASAGIASNTVRKRRTKPNLRHWYNTNTDERTQPARAERSRGSGEVEEGTYPGYWPSISLQAVCPERDWKSLLVREGDCCLGPLLRTPSLWAGIKPGPYTAANQDTLYAFRDLIKSIICSSVVIRWVRSVASIRSVSASIPAC